MDSDAQDEVLAARAARASALCADDKTGCSDGAQSPSALYDSPLARKMRLLAAQIEAAEAGDHGNGTGEACGTDGGDGADASFGMDNGCCEKSGETERESEQSSTTAATATQTGECHVPTSAAAPFTAGTDRTELAHLDTGQGDTADVAHLGTDRGEMAAAGATADGLCQDESLRNWYYIDRSGEEQGPHPLDHMRYWVQTAAIPASTLVRTCSTGAFRPAASFEAIVRGIDLPVAPVQGPADEALDRTTSVTKARAKRTRRPPSKRRTTATPRADTQDAPSAPIVAEDQMPCVSTYDQGSVVEVTNQSRPRAQHRSHLWCCSRPKG